MSVPFTELPVSTRRITVSVEMVDTGDNLYDDCELCDDNQAVHTCEVCNRRVCTAQSYTTGTAMEKGVEYITTVICVDCEALPLATREHVKAFVKDLNQ